MMENLKTHSEINYGLSFSVPDYFGTQVQVIVSPSNSINYP